MFFVKISMNSLVMRLSIELEPVRLGFGALTVEPFKPIGSVWTRDS